VIQARAARRGVVRLTGEVGLNVHRPLKRPDSARRRPTGPRGCGVPHLLICLSARASPTALARAAVLEEVVGSGLAPLDRASSSAGWRRRSASSPSSTSTSTCPRCCLCLAEGLWAEFPALLRLRRRPRCAQPAPARRSLNPQCRKGSWKEDLDLFRAALSHKRENPNWWIGRQNSRRAGTGTLFLRRHALNNRSTRSTARQTA